MPLCAARLMLNLTKCVINSHILDLNLICWWSKCFSAVRQVICYCRECLLSLVNNRKYVIQSKIKHNLNRYLAKWNCIKNRDIRQFHKLLFYIHLFNPVSYLPDKESHRDWQSLLSHNENNLKIQRWKATMYIYSWFIYIDVLFTTGRYSTFNLN